MYEVEVGSRVTPPARRCPGPELCRLWLFQALTPIGSLRFACSSWFDSEPRNQPFEIHRLCMSLLHQARTQDAQSTQQTTREATMSNRNESNCKIRTSSRGHNVNAVDGNTTSRQHQDDLNPDSLRGDSHLTEETQNTPAAEVHPSPPPTLAASAPALRSREVRPQPQKTAGSTWDRARPDPSPRTRSSVGGRSGCSGTSKSVCGRG